MFLVPLFVCAYCIVVINFTTQSDFSNMLTPFLCLNYAYIQILIFLKFLNVIIDDIFEYLYFSQHLRSILYSCSDTNLIFLNENIYVSCIKAKCESGNFSENVDVL